MTDSWRNAGTGGRNTADALRMTLITGNAPGNDMRFYWERVEASRNFANKVWNASRFMMMNIEKAPDSQAEPSDLTMADKWILSKANTLAREVTDNLDKYGGGHLDFKDRTDQFPEAASSVYAVPHRGNLLQSSGRGRRGDSPSRSFGGMLHHGIRMAGI